MGPSHAIEAIRRFSSTEISSFVASNGASLLEAEVLALLDNPHCPASVCETLAQNLRLTAFYSVRLRLVRNRATPLAQSVKLVHYLHWPDLLWLSVDVKVPAQVRRSVATQLPLLIDKISPREKIAAAIRYGAAPISVYLFRSHSKGLGPLLRDQR